MCGLLPIRIAADSHRIPESFSAVAHGPKLGDLRAISLPLQVLYQALGLALQEKSSHLYSEGYCLRRRRSRRWQYLNSWRVIDRFQDRFTYEDTIYRMHSRGNGLCALGNFSVESSCRLCRSRARFRLSDRLFRYEGGEGHVIAWNAEFRYTARHDRGLRWMSTMVPRKAVVIRQTYADSDKHPGHEEQCPHCRGPRDKDGDLGSIQAQYYTLPLPYANRSSP
jgi:hypothetical protein